jgi:GTP cyclohydrolase I
MTDEVELTVSKCKRCGCEYKEFTLPEYTSETTEKLCQKCSDIFSDELEYAESSFIGNEKIKEGMIKIFEGLEEEFKLNWKEDENFKGTPERIARSYIEKCRGINSKKRCEDILSIGFPTDYNKMIVIPGIKVFSLCPHHFENVIYSIDVGYIPNNKVVGLSKISRVAILYGAQPILHETLVSDLTDIYTKGLYTTDIIVRATGTHGCMTCRGIKQSGSCAVMVDYHGNYTDRTYREEFYNLIENSKRVQDRHEI